MKTLYLTKKFPQKYISLSDIKNLLSINIF